MAASQRERKMALDGTAVFVAVLCDDHTRPGTVWIFCFLEKNGGKFRIFDRKADASWNFPVFIALGMQQPVSRLLSSGYDTGLGGRIDGRMETSGETTGKKTER